MQPRKNVVASRDKLIAMMLATFNLPAIQAFFTRTAVEISPSRNDVDCRENTKIRRRVYSVTSSALVVFQLCLLRTSNFRGHQGGQRFLSFPRIGGPFLQRDPFLQRVETRTNWFIVLIESGVSP